MLIKKVQLALMDFIAFDSIACCHLHGIHLSFQIEIYPNLLSGTMSEGTKLVGEVGLEPTIDVISRTNYVSTAYKTASLLPY